MGWSPKWICQNQHLPLCTLPSWALPGGLQCLHWMKTMGCMENYNEWEGRIDGCWMEDMVLLVFFLYFLFFLSSQCHAYMSLWIFICKLLLFFIWKPATILFTILEVLQRHLPKNLFLTTQVDLQPSKL